LQGLVIPDFQVLMRKCTRLNDLVSGTFVWRLYLKYLFDIQSFLIQKFIDLILADLITIDLASIKTGEISLTYEIFTFYHVVMVMKLIPICYFLLISINLSAQSSQIDSLKTIIKSLKERDKVLHDSISLINRKISDLEFESLSNKDFVIAKIKSRGAVVKDRPGFFSTTIATLNKNNSVKIIGFKDDYWIINHNGKTGYLNEHWLSSEGSSIREDFKKMTIIQNEQNRLANKAITDSPKIRWIVTVRAGTVIHSEPRLSSKFEKIKIPIEIGIIDFDKEYYKIAWGDTVAYFDKYFFEETLEMKEYEKLRFAEKVAEKKKEQMKIEEERQAYEAKWKAIAAKKREERRKKLATKYGKAIADKIISKKIWLGMTDDMAIESRGYAWKTNRSVGSWGVKEQWVYGEISNRVYLYFENGKLTSWS